MQCSLLEAALYACKYVCVWRILNGINIEYARSIWWPANCAFTQQPLHLWLAICFAQPAGAAAQTTTSPAASPDVSVASPSFHARQVSAAACAARLCIRAPPCSWAADRAGCMPCSPPWSSGSSTYPRCASAGNISLVRLRSCSAQKLETRPHTQPDLGKQLVSLLRGSGETARWSARLVSRPFCYEIGQALEMQSVLGFVVCFWP